MDPSPLTLLTRHVNLTRRLLCLSRGGGDQWAPSLARKFFIFICFIFFFGSSVYYDVSLSDGAGLMFRLLLLLSVLDLEKKTLGNFWHLMRNGGKQVKRAIRNVVFSLDNICGPCDVDYYKASFVVVSTFLQGICLKLAFWRSGLQLENLSCHRK